MDKVLQKPRGVAPNPAMETKPNSIIIIPTDSLSLV